MKQLLRILFAIFITLCLFELAPAQIGRDSGQTKPANRTQTGIVKTRGRLDSKGKAIPGKRLSGVSVYIRGRNAVVTDADGSFSFPVPSYKFSIQSVRKQGYVLVDPDAISIQYVYSPNPLIIVMETSEKLKEDKLAVEQDLRQKLLHELNGKIDELEKLKDQNEITIEEYQTAWKKLEDEYMSSMELVELLAEQYCRIDYDQWSVFNQNFSDYINSGRLTEAYNLWSSQENSHSSVSNHMYAYEGSAVGNSSKARPHTYGSARRKRGNKSRSPQPEMCQVYFYCDVDDVPVFISIDGKQPSVFNSEGYTLSAGSHKVYITADGYEPYNETINVSRKDKLFYFELQKTKDEVESIEQQDEVID